MRQHEEQLDETVDNNNKPRDTKSWSYHLQTLR